MVKVYMQESFLSTGYRLVYLLKTLLMSETFGIYFLMMYWFMLTEFST